MQRSISTSAHPLENKSLDIYVYVYYIFFIACNNDDRRCRFIEHTADSSALGARSAIQINELNDKKKLLIRKQ
jgi:hypothetical protein